MAKPDVAQIKSRLKLIGAARPVPAPAAFPQIGAQETEYVDSNGKPIIG
jgi:hypothetical protein